MANYLNPIDSDKTSEPAPGEGFVSTGGYSPAKSSDAALPIPPPFVMSREYYQMDPQTPGSGLDERPVIPDMNLYRRDLEDDVVSSAMSSVDTLTTPPLSHTRYSRVIDMDTLPAAAPGHTRNGNSSNGYHDRSKY